MWNRLFWLLVLVLLVVGGYLYYKNYLQGHGGGGNGAIVCEGCMTPEQKARFDIKNSGGEPDGQSEHKTSLSRTLTSSDVDPARDFPQATPAPAPAPYPGPLNPYTGAFSPSQSGSAGLASTYPSQTYPPQTDTLRPNPPNGMVFAGRGTFQWYREGDITWRVNTETGTSCIDYATLQEWQKPLVLKHGCGTAR